MGCSGTWRARPTLHGVHDEGQHSAGLEHVVNHLGDRQLVGPVERLSERHQPERPRGAASGRSSARALTQRMLRQTQLSSNSPTLSQHVHVRVETDPRCV